MAEFTYSITEEIGVIEARGGWALELNKISWNHRPATFDLRKWTDDHEKMGKGVSMTESEARGLRDLLNDYFGED
jgi:hypothetical protein